MILGVPPNSIHVFAYGRDRVQNEISYSPFQLNAPSLTSLPFSSATKSSSLSKTTSFPLPSFVNLIVKSAVQV